MKNLLILFISFLGLSLTAQVGIGTTSPSEELDIESNDGTNTSIDINNTGAGDPLLHFQLSGSSVFTIGVDDTDDDKFKIGTTALETNTRLTINSDGDVGIGTTSPTHLLEVQNAGGVASIRIKGDGGTASTRAELKLDRTSEPRGGGIRIQASTDAGNEWWAGVPYDGGVISTGYAIGNHASQPEYIANAKMFISADGEVGVATSSPVSGLDVQTSMGLKVTTITSATTLDNTHNVVLCNTGAYSVTLPAAASHTGKVYYIKNIDTDGDNITVDGNGAETIDGQTTIVLWAYQDAVRIVSDGSNWHVIGAEGRKGVVVSVKTDAAETPASTGTDQIVDTWATTDLTDENGEFNNGTGVFTVGASGAGGYQFGVALRVNSVDATDYMAFVLYVNGSRYLGTTADTQEGVFAGIRGDQGSVNYTHYANGSISLNLSVGDTVSLYLIANTTGVSAMADGLMQITKI